jgi:hypothetical protein
MIYCCEGMFTAPLPSNRNLLLRGVDYIENTSTLLLAVSMCWALFTELLPGNVLITPITVWKEVAIVPAFMRQLCRRGQL